MLPSVIIGFQFYPCLEKKNLKSSYFWDKFMKSFNHFSQIPRLSTKDLCLKRTKRTWVPTSPMRGSLPPHRWAGTLRMTLCTQRLPQRAWMYRVSQRCQNSILMLQSRPISLKRCQSLPHQTVKKSDLLHSQLPLRPLDWNNNQSPYWKAA